jgi:hypothetical protein
MVDAIHYYGQYPLDPAVLAPVEVQVAAPAA